MHWYIGALEIYCVVSGQYSYTIPIHVPAEASIMPLGEKARARIELLCPDSRRTDLPSCTLHIRMVLSPDPVTT